VSQSQVFEGLPSFDIAWHALLFAVGLQDLDQSVAIAANLVENRVHLWQWPVELGTNIVHVLSQQREVRLLALLYLHRLIVLLFVDDYDALTIDHVKQFLRADIQVLLRDRTITVRLVFFVSSGVALILHLDVVSCRSLVRGAVMHKTCELLIRVQVVHRSPVLLTFHVLAQCRCLGCGSLAWSDFLHSQHKGNFGLIALFTSSECATAKFLQIGVFCLVAQRVYGGGSRLKNAHLSLLGLTLNRVGLQLGNLLESMAIPCVFSHCRAKVLFETLARFLLPEIAH